MAIRTILAVLAAVLAAGLASAQVTSINGVVTDSSGAVISGARVRAVPAAGGTNVTTLSNGQGIYHLPSLFAADYVVRVDADGFAPAEVKLTLLVGQTRTIDLQLHPAATSTAVEVTADFSSVSTTTSEVAANIDAKQMQQVPLNGRNWIELALLLPGISKNDVAGNTIVNGPDTGKYEFNVDGQQVSQDIAGSGTGQPLYSRETLSEFQIITNSYAAEYGRASGGVVNIITRSGSNDFHGDVYGYLRNRDFQAVNPFSTTSNPAYTRVQAGVAFGGPIKKDKTYYYFSYEVTRRHETGFSSIANPLTNLSYYQLAQFDTSQVGLPFGTLQLTPGASGQIGILTNPTVLAAEADPNVAAAVAEYAGIAGASSGMALYGEGLGGQPGFISDCQTPGSCVVPASYQSLLQVAQEGNFPVFEGTSLYSLRIDHNVSNSNRLTLRVNASPSTVTGIEGSGQDQPFGQNAYSRTSRQSYRDVAGVVQDTWTLGSSKVNEFRFQYARRGLNYFYNTQIAAGSYPAVNIPGFAYFGREPYSSIQRTETRYQFSDNLSWSIGRHNTKFGADFNYLPLKATFTVNYGGVFDIGPLSAAQALPAAIYSTLANALPANFPIPGLSAVQAYGFGVPTDFVQGIGNPTDSFSNKPLGVFWQDSWRVNHNLTVNYGVRYDVEFPPTFKPPTPLAQVGYNFLGLQKGIQTDKNNIQPRVGVAWDPNGNGKTVVRASFGMFYDHPLLGLYFLGDASDGSTSVQLAFPGGAPCSAGSTPFSPANLNAASVFTGSLLNCMNVSQLNYLPNQQQFNSTQTNSLYLNQNYLTNTPAPYAPYPFPLAFQPFGYPLGKNFVYAYSQQANLTIERDLGDVVRAELVDRRPDDAVHPVRESTAHQDEVGADLLVGEQLPHIGGIVASFESLRNHPVGGVDELPKRGLVRNLAELEGCPWAGDGWVQHPGPRGSGDWRRHRMGHYVDQ